MKECCESCVSLKLINGKNYCDLTQEPNIMASKMILIGYPKEGMCELFEAKTTEQH